MILFFLPESWRLWIFGIRPVRRPPGERTYMETELERRGNLKELQQHRFERFYKFFRYYEKDPFSTLLNIETSLRETFQREVTLKQKLIKAKTGNKEHGDSYYRAITEKLDELNQKYWLLERDWWAKRSSLPEGPGTRGLSLWRSHPRWYMHRVLIDDCAGKGGCCGRECGCCSSREMVPARRLGVGHCTIECGCCIKSRGFMLNPKQKKEVSARFRLSEKSRAQDLLSRDSKNYYYNRIVMASIWGLLQESQDSAFDLIDKSATVDHDAIACMGLGESGTPNSGYLSDEGDESTSTELL